MSAKTIERDTGYRRILKTLAGLRSKPYVKIGVTEKSDDRDDGADNFIVAVCNEFGTSIKAGRSGGQIILIPERSFIRSNHDENQNKYQKRVKEYKDQILAGRMTTDEALKKIGLEVQRDVRKKIVDIKEPPNAPATIARKKSENPLVDTGQLIGAIDYEINRER